MTMAVPLLYHHVLATQPGSSTIPQETISGVTESMSIYLPVTSRICRRVLYIY
jgi:hypothetical protein